MPLVIKLKPGPYVVHEPWANPAERDPAKIKREITAMDDETSVSLFIDDLGGLEGIVESIKWVEE